MPIPFLTVPEAVVEITSLFPQGPNSLLVQWVEPDQRLVHSDLTSVTYVIKYTERDGTGEIELPLRPEERVGLVSTGVGWLVSTRVGLVSTE